MTRPVDFEQFRLGQDPIERRERRPVAMHAFIATEQGATGEAWVLDLSYEGCGIETPLTLTAGQNVTLSVDGRGAVHGCVRWWSDGKGGLTFQKEEAAGEQPRSEARVELKVQASLRRLGLGSFRVDVSDLSRHGCKVDVVERPRVGEHVLLKFDQMEAIDAEVSWVRDHDAGLRFERPVHEAVFEQMMRRFGGSAR